MANYDDNFNASQSVETDEKSYSSFDKKIYPRTNCSLLTFST